MYYYYVCITIMYYYYVCINVVMLLLCVLILLVWYSALCLVYNLLYFILCILCILYILCILCILCKSIGRDRLEHVNGEERDPYTQTPQTHPSVIQMMRIQDIFRYFRYFTCDEDTRYFQIYQIFYM